KLYSRGELEALDHISCADWLRRQRQSESVIEWFWRPLIVGVCNGPLHEVSARHAINLVRLTLLDSPQAAAICFLRRPLSAVFDRLARQVLENAGVNMRLGQSVSAIQPGKSVSVSANGEIEKFDRVILALPVKRLHSLFHDAIPCGSPGPGAIAG